MKVPAKQLPLQYSVASAEHRNKEKNSFSIIELILSGFRGHFENRTNAFLTVYFIVSPFNPSISKTHLWQPF